MSSGCGDVLSLADLQTAKKHQIFEAEVITGKSGGVAGGADIDYATNHATMQVQKTMPAILRDLGFTPVSWDFSAGGTLTVNTRDKVVYDPASQTWYSYSGTLPVVVPAGFNPVGNANWKPRTDPDLRDELGDSSSVYLGDALVAVKQPLDLSYPRTQHSKNTDHISVLDFGADRTGVNPSTAAFQAALDACSDKNGISGFGRALYIPAGKYKIDGNLTYTWRATSGLDDGNIRRLSIIGDGSANTFINDVRTSPGTEPLLHVNGGVPPAQDPHLRLSMQGFRVQRPDNGRVGWGLYFQNIAFMRLVDVDSHWFSIGAVFHDVIQVQAQHCQMGANVTGMVMGRLNWTQPNVFDMQHIMFGGTAENCVVIDNGANIKFDTCSFEGTGSDKTLHNCIKYTGASEEGGIGLTVKNCYFENNNVFADINIQSSSATKCVHIIEGNTFQRTSPTSYCTTHINFNISSAAGAQRMHLRGNRFRFAGGYAHTTGEASIVAQSAWSEVIEEGNLYETVQPPQYPASAVVKGFGNTVVACGKIHGGITPSVAVGAFNIASVVYAGTGSYIINFTKSLSNANCLVLATPNSAPGVVVVTEKSSDYVKVTTLNNAWNASDTISFDIAVIGFLL